MKNYFLASLVFALVGILSFSVLKVLFSGPKATFLSWSILGATGVLAILILLFGIFYKKRKERNWRNNIVTQARA